VGTGKNSRIANRNGNGHRDSVAVGARIEREVMISNAENVAAQLAAKIAAAEQPLRLGSLNITQQLALTATVQAALAAQTELAAKLAAAENALRALNTAINSGNAAEIAAAATAA